MILLLVEDEDIIRRGFLVTIQKLELRFDLILEARDGEEGLRLFENYHPDIVITDIRMPLMDGLTFIQKSREISHESRFIVLSGYNDFEYARTALRYEVRDYLLKPSSKAEIRDVLLRVMEEIQKAETESSALKERLDDYDLRLNQFHQLLLGDILLGKYADTEIAPLLSHHAISLPEQGFCVLCFQIFHDPVLEEYADCKQEYHQLNTLLSHFFDLYPADMATSHRCCIASPHAEYGTFLSLTGRLLAKLEAYQRQAGIKLYLSISDTDSFLKNLPERYEQSLELFLHRFFHPDRILLYSAVFQQDPAPITLPGAMLEALYHSFVSSSRFDLRQNFLKILRYVVSFSDTTPQRFHQALEQIADYLAVSLIRADLMPARPIRLDFDMREGFMICRDLEALYGFLLSSLMQYRNAVTGKRNTAAIESVHSPIDRAIAYIDQNYYKELDLALLSQLVSMNSSYFSSQFKKKTGLSFSTYLQNVRLEKAKNMLLHSDQKLHEISAAIGIGNVKYFCRLFKNYTGVTPTEYKRQFQISDS